jgi:hypothetical protein
MRTAGRFVTCTTATTEDRFHPWRRNWDDLQYQTLGLIDPEVGLFFRDIHDPD